MDGERFDAMTKTLAAGPTRRRLLLGLLGGAFGLLGGLGPGEAGAHNPLRACKKIEDRKRRRRCLRRARQHNALHAAQADCLGQADGNDCGTGQECSGEVCATPSGCRNINCFGDSMCCSGKCNNPGVSGFCNSSIAGQPCGVDTDCQGLSGECVGFVCQ